MSLAAIKQKETKGKKNVLPKLRTILANPYKQHSPVLPDNEVLELQNILKTAITESEHTQQTFATKTHIQLGLESSLRAINARRFSCVFISLSLRPSHIVRLIATTAAIKVPTAPIYAQPKLEELTHGLFGVRALALVLPLDLNSISSELANWVNARMKPLVPKSVTLVSAKSNRKRKSHEQLLKKTSIEPKKATPAAEKEWSGDYISCSNEGGILKLDQVDVKAEMQQLSAALSKLVQENQNKDEITVKETSTPEKAGLPTIEPMDIEITDTVEDDEFLPTDLANYQPLIVHQIRSNPDKKPKKKRNKNKKQKAQPPQKKTN
ncbi:uncharacterized protein Dvir_GJ10766 [Drosophila virilis]|uniref:Ribosomal protein L7Ae/L30e/S12e/Gadd45 domain-containing protein n=2 Tax=Drosophila virilis TaxID=7244 RepID=B4M6F6_DROVI|nr:uncharacterized protein Dvir_GJ10766 [Drosophila virilis]